MAFTRFHDDAARVMKHLQESTDQGLYHINTPGNGTQMPFVADPHVRLQKCGANRHANFVLLESELFGIGANNYIFPKKKVVPDATHLQMVQFYDEPRLYIPVLPPYFQNERPTHY